MVSRWGEEIGFSNRGERRQSRFCFIKRNITLYKQKGIYLQLHLTPKNKKRDFLRIKEQTLKPSLKRVKTGYEEDGCNTSRG